MSYALSALVLAFALFAAGILVYVLGSFALMRRHTPARSFSSFLRALLRETFLAAVTQPLLPLYYLIGHRMEPLLLRRAREAFGKGAPVVFVHGYMQNRIGFLGLARALARRGLGPLFGFNYPWFAALPDNAKRLERYVARVCAETKTDAVDLVCHSMGGLVALEMLRSLAKKEERRVRRCVTIASPHAGVMWRGPVLGTGGLSLRRGSELLTTHAGYALQVPTLSIFSTHDNVVHPKETSQLAKRGGRDAEVEGFAHLSILFSPAVADLVVSFLTEPDPSEAIVAADGRGHDDRAGASEDAGEGDLAGGAAREGRSG